jgi:hypothetical protein
MAASSSTEYVGLDIIVQINGSSYRVQECRVRIHGDLGDLTSSEDQSKRRKATVPDAEVTLTKASFDPDNNPFTSPVEMTYGSQVSVVVYPGGLGGTEPYSFPGMVVDDSDWNANANALQPITCHLMQGDGGDPTEWYAGVG